MHANPYWLLVCDPSTHVPPLRQRLGVQAFLTTKKQIVLKVKEETGGKIYICPWFWGRVWNKLARKKVLTILEKIHGEVRLPHSPQIKDWKIVRLGVRAASSFFLGGWGYVCCSILFFLPPPLPSPGLTINQTHLGYVYSITDSFTGLKKKIEFPLVVWASTILILLTRGHFVLIIVNDFFGGWLPQAFA